MKHLLIKYFLFFVILTIASSSNSALGAVRTSIGVNGGLGLPIGWWSERWDPLLISEINLKYEFTPGTGILLLAGLGKAYFGDLSDSAILSESSLSNLPPEFEPYAKINYSSQSGSFRQIPVGFGFYTERLIRDFGSTENPHQLRGYGSAAMIVHLWQFERNQNLTREVAVPDKPVLPYEDVWSDDAEGSNVGVQVAIGLLYQLRDFLYVDISAAYHFVDIGQRNGAVAYYGQPARIRSDQYIESAEGRADIIQLRVGIRYGR